MIAPLFILASTSPRRKALLETLGLPFAVADNPWNEVPRHGERPESQVRRLTREKLLHFIETHPDNRLPVLTADTLLAFRGMALNKPRDKDEAWAFYQQLAGRTHRVLTSFALWTPHRVVQRTKSTEVTFVTWNESLYKSYLERGEWRDAAGGYKIQEGGGVLVRRIKGSWTNIVGLPLAEVYDIISATLRVPKS
jgi:septum formation protein